MGWKETAGSRRLFRLPSHVSKKGGTLQFSTNVKDGKRSGTYIKYKGRDLCVKRMIQLVLTWNRGLIWRKYPLCNFGKKKLSCPSASRTRTTHTKLWKTWWKPLGSFVIGCKKRNELKSAVQTMSQAIQVTSNLSTIDLPPNKRVEGNMLILWGIRRFLIAKKAH